MRFSIVTPSFKQLDWLGLCVASVRDQVTLARGEGRESRVEGAEDRDRRAEVRGVGGDGEIFIPSTLNHQRSTAASRLSVEHIVQDAGTPGIEEFAREVGAEFHRDGILNFKSQPSAFSPQVSYTLAIYSEKDAGMYDAINRGLGKACGEICAYLNCDEQYLPGALPWVADYFSAHPQTDVLFGAAIVVKPDGSYVCDRRVMVPTPLHTMVSGNLSVFTSSTFFRRSAVVDRGLLFDPRWKVVGDAAWVLGLIEAKVRMAATNHRLSAFAETGGNLSADPKAVGEQAALAVRAPVWARRARPLVLAHYRIRRFLAGAYSLEPHRYAIYTAESPEARKEFVVSRPGFRWAGPQ